MESERKKLKLYLEPGTPNEKIPPRTRRRWASKRNAVNQCSPTTFGTGVTQGRRSFLLGADNDLAESSGDNSLEADVLIHDNKHSGSTTNDLQANGCCNHMDKSPLNDHDHFESSEDTQRNDIQEGADNDLAESSGDHSLEADVLIHDNKHSGSTTNCLQANGCCNHKDKSPLNDHDHFESSEDTQRNDIQEGADNDLAESSGDHSLEADVLIHDNEQSGSTTNDLQANGCCNHKNKSPLNDHDHFENSEDMQRNDIQEGADNDLTESSGDHTRDPFRGYDVKELCDILLALATKVRHKMTFAAMDSVLKLMCVDSNPPKKPLTKYKLKAAVNKFTEKMTVHFLCVSCGKYLGVREDVLHLSQGNLDLNSDGTSSVDDPGPADLSSSFPCPKCNALNSKRGSLDKGNALVYFSLASQLEYILTLYSHLLVDIDNRKKQCSLAIEDIFDGKIYWKSDNARDYLTMSFSIDGASVSDSSGAQAWPVLCTLNNFPLKITAKFLMLACVWLGSGKPLDMNEYLIPFVTETKELYSSGFTYFRNGEKRIQKVRFLNCIADAVARVKVQKSTQFNGKNGCGLCLHPGTNEGVPSRVYPYTHDYPRRTHEETLRHAEQATPEARVFGILGKAIVSEIPNFNIIDGLDADSMHGIYYGVCRQIAKCWFDSTGNTGKDYYCGLKTADVKARIVLIKFLPGVSRIGRSLDCRSDWKAHEWAHWLFLISVPVMKGILPEPYLKHWCLLVDAIYILSKSSIMKSEIVVAERNLVQFVKNVPALYGLHNVSFNVHQLVHAGQSVRNFGPLPTHSAFLYESYNSDMLSTVHSSNGVAVQIIDSFRMKCAVNLIKQVCSPYLTPEQSEYLSSLESNKVPKTTLKVGDTCLHGSFIEKKISGDLIRAFRKIRVDIRQETTVKHFLRATVRGMLIQGTSYARLQTRSSSTVLLKDDSVFEVVEFIVCDANDACFCIGKYYNLQKDSFVQGARLPNIIMLGHQSVHTAIVPAASIAGRLTICKFPTDNIHVACQMPNTVELLT